ncbi:hypothetical protein ADP71_33700 [Vitreoscilla sp. C1]|uniref:bestrophin-like domain n=1 Tax=Vitreoscilla sp. (strain C1) TaxID=96942 RepID=UPI00148ED18E|nr:hypothetical protein [Vitreoscilla sp. C1]AUZ06506.2 hypothetical protein ADP71_33700 [Vitreoscilla sp. C1]
MHGFFTWHPLWLLICFVGLAVLLFLFGAMSLRRFMRQAQADSNTMPIPVFLSTLATTWALAFGFVASDIWSVNNQAAQAASAERSSLSRLLGMTQIEALNDGVLHQQLTVYRSSVSQFEWGRDLNAAPNSEVEQALQAIRMGLLARADAGNTPDTITARMIDDFDELQDARNERLAIGASNINAYKWCFLIVFSLLVQLAVAAIHADRLQGGRRAVGWYAIMVAMSLYVLALHVNPYTGASSVHPQILFSMQL